MADILAKRRKHLSINQSIILYFLLHHAYTLKSKYRYSCSISLLKYSYAYNLAENYSDLNVNNDNVMSNHSYILIEMMKTTLIST